MTAEGAPDFKATLNLPVTSFPMRANLPAREPEILARWEREGLYTRMLEQRAGAPRFVLHDGPPYANGNIHLGHALNKIVKDFIVKYKHMTGHLAPYVPGWDCHGLPIELQVEKSLGREKRAALSKLEVRRLCREYAARFVDVQRDEFKRLGVLGDWSNPYLTMDFGYEATEVRELAKVAASGDLYRGKKPVHWCASCRTALAEAEVEYRDVASPSVYVAFALREPYPEALRALAGTPIDVAIWTTTPWTLPANLAIAAHPDVEYVVVPARSGRSTLVAKALLPRLSAFLDPDVAVRATVIGRALEGARAHHPWIDRDSMLVLGEHVTLDTGTGLVHTAPGHGQEDYDVGRRYGLDVYAPVDDAGRFLPEVAEFAGMRVFDADARIVEHLQSVGRLLATEPLTHSYPHCWRCKHPVIFRATEQWFISMEKNRLRERALAAIERVRWIPAWGKDRIAGMVANRPDWCISRQRAWGVPIVALHCERCGVANATPELLAHVAEIFARESADAWFARPIAELVPPGLACTGCGATTFRKEEDILDVWFDSGVSFATVVERRPELGGHADLYFEGSDQHRGWFQSSLLASVATRDRAPYDTVLTHGFFLDEDARKMSKSSGNVVAPQKIVATHGADILRLWVSAEDYREDMRISREILERAVEAYRRIRNTARFLLGNLADFVPARDAVAAPALLEVDRFALDRLQAFVARCGRAYDAFEFHAVYHALNNFCSVDLSALYLDIVKDRLYCEGATSMERRSAQTTLHALLDGLVRVMAPVLSFTAEEIWSCMPGDEARPASVHLADFPCPDPTRIDAALAGDWERLLEVRAAVTKALEALRQRGEIGHSLEASVRLGAAGALGVLLESRRALLAEILIVSQVEVLPSEQVRGESTMAGLAIEVERAAGQKCARCWNWRLDVGGDPRFPSVCGRCAAVLASGDVRRPS
jgi:isoleucyl-tRNA synthetase